MTRCLLLMTIWLCTKSRLKENVKSCAAPTSMTKRSSGKHLKLKWETNTFVLVSLTDAFRSLGRHIATWRVRAGILSSRVLKQWETMKIRWSSSSTCLFRTFRLLNCRLGRTTRWFWRMIRAVARFVRSTEEEKMLSSSKCSMTTSQSPR